MISRRRLLQASGTALVARVSGARAAEPKTVAIMGARLHPGDGRRIDEGTLVIEGSRVLAVGAKDQVDIPADATIIDGRDAWVTPGLFDAESLTGLVDIHGEPSARDDGLDANHDPVRAGHRSLDGWNPRAQAIAATRLEGVTTVALAPRRGLISGQGAVMRLAGSDASAMTVLAPSAVYASATWSGRQLAFGARGGVMLRLRELFDDVRVYANRKQDFERNQMRTLSASRLDLEALIPIVQGQLPLVVEAQRASDIEALLRFAADEKVRLVLSGCEEGWLIADRLAAAKVPVIVNALVNLPLNFDALEATLENAARLHQAGVKLCLSPREFGDHQSRTLRFQAGNAVANGLPWEAGLAAISRHPAEVFGVAGELGTLAPGKLADVVVWSGDPFEPLTRPRRLYMAGVELPLRSRQSLLRERYRR